MSGWVTVSGPPRASWRWNSGTTEPVLPSTLPNRTVMQRMPWPRVACGDVQRLAVHLGQPLRGAHHRGRVHRLVGGDQHHGARARPRAPRRRHGACRRRWSAGPPAGWPRPSARASAPRRGTPVPGGIARTPRGCAPRRGCRRAARWRRDLRDGVSASSRSICHSAYSPLSSRISSSGPSAATWRASSLPMVPPAPVTMTRRPWISRAMPSRSSGTCGRFSRSSMATGRSSSWPRRYGRAGRAERGRPRRAAHREAVALGLFTRSASACAGQVGRGDHERVGQPVLGRSAIQHGAGIGERAEDRMPLDAPAGLARTDGEQSLHLEGLAPVAGQGAQEQVRLLACADQKNRARALIRRPGDTAVLHAAIADARDAQQHEQRRARG